MNPLIIINPILHKGEYILAPLEAIRIKVFIKQGKSTAQIADLMLESDICRRRRNELMASIIESCKRQYPETFKDLSN